MCVEDEVCRDGSVTEGRTSDMGDWDVCVYENPCVKCVKSEV